MEELRQAAEAQRLRTLPGLGAKTEERILKSLDEKPQEQRTLLASALPAVLAVIDVLREHPASNEVSEAGSVRRRTETVRDLDIIATADDPAALTDYFAGLNWVSEVEAKGKTKATVVSHDGLRFDLRVVPPDSYGNLLQHFTGSKAHNVALREDAVRQGLSVSEYGVKDVESGEVFTARTEEELYERLGYQWIPPELREGRGELDAARKGELPALVELSDLRGDLHMHSTWSTDGKDTLEDMATAAKARGYAYVAITDHAHYLRNGRFAAQAKEIAALNERLKPFRILRGIEVSIRGDGALDFPDEDLVECDWVMASLHFAFDRSPTERVLAAMENPHVDGIGHLTARKLNKRSGTEIAVDKVIEKALETGTFLEINSQPDRLDLRDVHARAAGEAGLKLAISSDGHELGALDFVELGVAQARRAWLTKDQVLNTRSWREIEKLKKRGEVPRGHLRPLADACPLAVGIRQATPGRARPSARRCRPRALQRGLDPPATRAGARPDRAAPALDRRRARAHRRPRDSDDAEAGMDVQVTRPARRRPSDARRASPARSPARDDQRLLAGGGRRLGADAVRRRVRLGRLLLFGRLQQARSEDLRRGVRGAGGRGR